MCATLICHEFGATGLAGRSVPGGRAHAEPRGDQRHTGSGGLPGHGRVHGWALKGVQRSELVTCWGTELALKGLICLFQKKTLSMGWGTSISIKPFETENAVSLQEVPYNHFLRFFRCCSDGGSSHRSLTGHTV